MKEKLAVFDVDGTLFKGDLAIEFIKVLVQKEILKKEIGDNIFYWYGKYKSCEVEKSVAIDEGYKLYAQGMKGVTVEKANEMATETWQLIKDRVYTFAPDITKTLETDGYIVLLVSASPIEMVRELGRFLNIGDENMAAGTLEIIDGIYTGNIVSYPGSAEQKVEELNRLIIKKNIDVDWPRSIGMGDDERDFGVLGVVGCPIAFTPNDKLIEKANANGWVIANVETVAATIKEIIKAN